MLGGALAAMDLDRGRSTSAQVTTAVRRLARAGASPARGHGVVRVIVDDDGTVAGVTTTSASWTNSARALRAALAGRRFPAPGGQGVVISYLVEADVTRTREQSVEPSRAGTGSQEGGMALDQAPRMAVVGGAPTRRGPRHVVTVDFLREDPR